MLEAIDAAIVSLLTSRIQATTIGDKSYTFADLRVLREMREFYAAKLAAAAARPRAIAKCVLPMP
jgi:hypothetical protein